MTSRQRRQQASRLHWPWQQQWVVWVLELHAWALDLEALCVLPGRKVSKHQ